MGQLGGQREAVLAALLEPSGSGAPGWHAPKGPRPQPAGPPAGQEGAVLTVGERLALGPRECYHNSDDNLTQRSFSKSVLEVHPF